MDGLKPLDSSFLHALSPRLASQASTSGSLETTKESSKVGGRAGVEIGKPTKYSDVSMTSQILTNAFLSHVTLPARKTQQTAPQVDSTHRLLTSSQLSASQSLSGNLLLTHISNLTTEQSTGRENPCLVPSVTTNRLRHRPSAAQVQPHTPVPSPSCQPKPSAYSPNLCPLPSPLRPHCLARELLRRWRLSLNVSSCHLLVELAPEELERVFNVMSNAWAESTRESYSSGILVYHVFCDVRNIPEESRAPANQTTITSFIVSLAGSYSGSAISYHINSIRAWHILHSLNGGLIRWRLTLRSKGLTGSHPLLPRGRKGSRTPPISSVDCASSSGQKTPSTLPFLPASQPASTQQPGSASSSSPGWMPSPPTATSLQPICVLIGTQMVLK